MKKKILIFIFLVITVGGIIFTAFTAYRFSTITDLAIKHSADIIKNVYLYSKDKTEALNIIKNMPNIENVKIVNKKDISKNYQKNYIIESLNPNQVLEIKFKSLGEFGNEKYNVILETIIINLIFIALSNILLNILITPYLNIFEEFRKSIENSKKGDFSIKIHTKLKNEIKKLVESYNSFITQLDNNFKLLNHNLNILIPNAPQQSNKLKSIEENMQILADINKFKKIIEEDANIEEIYNRLIDIFENKFKIQNFKIYAVVNAKQKITTIYQKGENCCEIPLPNLCRAYRTSKEINSIKFPHICSEHTCKNLRYICIPFSTGGTFTGIVSINMNEEEYKNKKDLIPYIESYLNEAVSIIEAKYTLNLMRQSSLTDQLTGLYNRRYLEEILEKIAASSVREKSLLGVLMIDVDYFKKVNDTYGHDAGDKVLKELSKLLLENVRESDFVVRFSGEEFIVILQNIKDEEGIIKVAEKIRKAFENTKININGKIITKTISIGVAIYPTNTDKIWEAIKFADLALYEAKNTGRNKVITFSEEILEKSDYKKF